MDVNQTSFMLLPDFSFLPDKDIALGRLMPRCKDSKLPDPCRIIKSKLGIQDHEIQTQILSPWSWDSDEVLSVAAGSTVDAPFLTGVGLGFDVKRVKASGLKITTTSIRQVSFAPSAEDEQAIINDKFVANLMKQTSRPALYLITGLMIADGATIELKRGSDMGGQAQVSTDLSAIGAPVNLRLHGGMSTASHSVSRKTVHGEFILAYRLLRLQKKLLRAPKFKKYDDHALFDDEMDSTDQNASQDYNIRLAGPADFAEEEDP